MSYKIDFEIPCAKASDLPRNLNSTIQEKKYFTWQRAKWRRLIAKYVYARPSIPLAKAKLQLFRYSSREPDFDGLVASFKAIIDSLVHCGVLQNDKMSNIGQPEYRWIKAKKGDFKIRVVVEELSMESKTCKTENNDASKKANDE